MGTIDINAKNQPEAIHAGVNAAICHISISVSWSSGDVHRIGKIPNGAIPLDAVFYPGAASGAALIAKFGTSASQEAFFNSATYSVVARTSKRLGIAAQVSISDDAAALFDWITMVATNNTSIGHVGDLVVYYKMPGQNL